MSYLRSHLVFGTIAPALAKTPHTAAGRFHHIMSSIPHWSPETDRDWYIQACESLRASPPDDPDYWAKSIRYWRASRALWANEGNSAGIASTTRGLIEARRQARAEREASK